MRAKGIFTWPAEERRSDRYGMVALACANYDETAHARVELDEAALMFLCGRRVRIVATVLESRESGHIGDIFRGIYPVRPEIGEIIDLGSGAFVVAPTYYEDIPLTFGILPDDGRDVDWFDPRLLYRLHDQTVRLDITETNG